MSLAYFFAFFAENSLIIYHSMIEGDIAHIRLVFCFPCKVYVLSDYQKPKLHKMYQIYQIFLFITKHFTLKNCIYFQLYFMNFSSN